MLVTCRIELVAFVLNLPGSCIDNIPSANISIVLSIPKNKIDLLIQFPQHYLAVNKFSVFMFDKFFKPHAEEAAHGHIIIFHVLMKQLLCQPHTYTFNVSCYVQHLKKGKKMKSQNQISDQKHHMKAYLWSYHCIQSFPKCHAPTCYVVRFLLRQMIIKVLT